MNLQALGTRVLVKMDPRENEIEGIFIPDAYLQREVIGEVVSIGDYVELVDIGDRVLLRNNCGIEVVIDEGEFSIIEESDILGRIDEDVDHDDLIEQIEKALNNPTQPNN